MSSIICNVSNGSNLLGFLLGTPIRLSPFNILLGFQFLVVFMSRYIFLSVFHLFILGYSELL